MIRITEQAIQPFEKEHIRAVRELAPECTLLLKKDGTLPLTAPCKVALYGSGARKTIKGGTGSGDVNVRHFTTAEEGLKNAGFEITSGEWIDSYDRCLADARKAFVEQVRSEAKALGLNPIMYSMGKSMPEPEYDFPLDAEGDLAVYVLSRNSGEGSDRLAAEGDIKLSKAEIRDILKVNESYEKFVLVLNTGGMVDLKPVVGVKNILLLGQLGTPTGDVLADLLLGRSYPSGKLAMTWAPIEDYPGTEDFGDPDDTYYKEGIYVGYRYFDTAGKTPLYPFGYGLSFTEFEVRPMGLTADKGRLAVDVKVTNTGNHAGKEVVQVYYSAPAGRLDHPYQELAAFAKTGELQPGSSEFLSVTFQAADMASYDTDNAAWYMEKGDYVIRVGNACDHTVEAGVARLPEDVFVKRLKNICPGWGFDDMRLSGAAGRQGTDLPVAELDVKDLVSDQTVYSDVPDLIPEGEGCSWKQVEAGEKTVDDFVAGLDERQLAYLSMGLFYDEAGMGSMIGAASEKVAGAAGETTKRLEELGVPTLVMADGPAGLRLCREYKMVNGKAKGTDNPLAGMLEFADPEMLSAMAAQMPKPTEEELAAPVNYTYCVAIPIGTGIAQSFNEDLGEKLGDIIGEEMEMFGIQLWLAPAMNIQRTPLCGRNFEYYSEDPLVSGLTAAAITKGVQAHKGCGTTIKHYAANNQETNRTGSNSAVSERALREIYLKGFEICVRQSMPASIMSSYNLVNGEHTNNSKDLVTYVLRDEWGYKGVVMTDWYAADDMMNQANPRKNKHVPGYASGCIHAGNDLTMPGIKEEFEDILNALTDTTVPYPITKAELQVTAGRVLNMVLRLHSVFSDRITVNR